MEGLKHTPGPWRVSDSHPCRVVVADGLEVNETQGDDVCVARTDGDWFDDDDSQALEANARLIAAAPELLDRLAALLGAAKRGGALEHHVTSAEAAIAKAIGGGE